MNGNTERCAHWPLWQLLLALTRWTRMTTASQIGEETRHFFTEKTVVVVAVRPAADEWRYDWPLPLSSHIKTTSRKTQIENAGVLLGGESDLLHGCPGLSKWSGETVGERPSLSADIRLYLHPYGVAKAQRVRSLEWEIPREEIQQETTGTSDEGDYINILIYIKTYSRSEDT